MPEAPKLRDCEQHAATGESGNRGGRRGRSMEQRNIEPMNVKGMSIKINTLHRTTPCPFRRRPDKLLSKEGILVRSEAIEQH